MSRSLSWFDEEALRKLFSGAGTRVRARQGTRGPMLVTVASSVTPSTLVGQFGHANRFAGAQEGHGRFAPVASTQPGPPPDVGLPIILDGDELIRPEPFDPKATRLAAGTSPPPDDRPTDDVPVWMPSHDSEPGIFKPPSGASIEEKVDSYLAWAMRVCGATAGFVADREGLLVAWRGAGVTTDLGALCAAMEHGFARLESDALAAPVGHAIVERKGERVLIVWAARAIGRLYAGLCAPSLPAQAAILFAAEAFRTLVDDASKEEDHG